jgi:drug/metabolite transporter (DMT)-like permease
MTAPTLALVLTAALLHALWNIVAKRAGGDARFSLLTALLVTVLWAPAGIGFGVAELPTWTTTAWLVIGASAVVHVAYFNALLAGYRAADLTVVYPVARGSGPLLTAIAAVLLLGEAATVPTVAGVAGIAAGVFLIAGGPGLLRRSLRPVAAAAPASAGDRAARDRLRSGLAWGFATGALIATYSVIDGYAIKVLAMSPIVFDYVCNVLRVPLLAPLALRDPAGFAAVCRATWKPAVVVALLGPLAYILVLTALQSAPLSHVAPAREASMLFAALIGGHLLGEGDRRARIAGAIAIGLGVAVLAAG